ncbi:hypothetical protein GQ53DRAFT_776147 [Thozetella sp. PMI_491]|nr:hypothetical protein GQ53DRAFT_776147 [Thozetella sp. PMI_491]
MEEAPFEEWHQLCDTLKIEGSQILRQPRPPNPTKVTKAAKTYLPGDPRIQLTGPDIGNHLQAEFITKDLNCLAPHLWLMTTQSSANISSLTEQIVRGRRIVVSENPGLHLVWINDRVFLKPMPKYLLSHAFWKYYLLSNDSPIAAPVRQSLLEAARGFVRSYAYLIRHKSDFALATREDIQTPCLLPKGISYADFVVFIGRYHDIDDSLVSPRYHFGELRLARLNLWSRVFLSKPRYHKVEWEYADYFSKFYAPVLFIFAVFSLLLSAMQVTLAVQTFLAEDSSWFAFARVSRGFSILSILFVLCVIVLFVVTFALSALREVIYAAKDWGNVRTRR